MAIILARPDDGLEMNLYPVEYVRPIIRSYFKAEPHVNNVAETVGDVLQEIYGEGGGYGTSYLALLPVDPTGFAALPGHVQRVSRVTLGPHGDGRLLGTSPPEHWYPGLGVRGRQWAADQYGSTTLWRLGGYESLSGFPWPRGSEVDYRRVEGGLDISALAHQSGFGEPTIAVLYDAKITDERGFCFCNDLDAKAAAHLWNYNRWQADFFSGNLNAQGPMSIAWRLKEKAVAVARTGEGLSDNALSRILQMGASWDRPDVETGQTLPTLGTGRLGGAGYYGY